MEFVINFWDLILEASPWLVLGFFIGGIFKSVISDSFLNKHLRNNSMGSVIKATILGAPLPICSCGVIPVAVSLRQSGVSKSATAAFLVSTPETGVDSVSISYSLLGPVIAIIRPIAALASALAVGFLVLVFDKDTEINQQQNNLASTDSSCCKVESTPDVAAPSCCDSTSKSENVVFSGIKYSFTKLLDDIVLWLLFGLAFSALIQTYVPAGLLAEWGSSSWAMFLMLLVGVPVYVCATASTPVAAGLILAGVSPGVAMVFLMAGPATNMATMGVINKILGKKTLLLYLFGVCSIALTTGFTVDYLLEILDINILTQIQGNSDTVPFAIQLICFLILFISVTRNLWRKT